MMHEREPAFVHAHHHFVPEHAARGSASELLDVRAAEPAREHLDRAFGLGNVHEPRPAVRV